MCTLYNDSVIHGKILANHFADLCKNFSPPYRDENPLINRYKAEINNNILHFLAQTKRLVQEGKCDIESFKRDVMKIKKTELIHLEIIWYLQIYNLIPLHEILRFHENNKNKDIIQHIALKFFHNILNIKSPPQSAIRKKMIQHYIKAIFCDMQYNQGMNNYEYSVQQNILNLLTTETKELVSDTTDNLLLKYNNLDLLDLVKIFEEANLSSQSLSSFVQIIVDSLLQGSPQTIETIFHTQENIKCLVKEKKIYEFYIKISRFIEVDDLIKLLKTLLLEKSETFNCENGLTFISFIGNTCINGWSKLKKLSELILNQAFKKFDPKLMCFTFLIARQGCLERCKNCFPSYLHWFGSTFSSKSCTLLKTKEMCNFFFNFLVDIIPIDPAYYLKVHINRIPNVPEDCKCIANDYVELVKAELTDLNVSVEVGICENSTNISAATFDVENVLKHFERTNNILNSVFQASMFSKTYYEKKFLAELLSKFEGKNSVRHKLIIKLNSLGKIPKSSFKKYKNIEKSYVS